MTIKYIHTRVTDLILEHHTRDPYAIARALHIEILTTDLGSLRGMVQWVNGLMFIFLNRNMDAQMRLMVCAHELGHAFLHREILDLMGGMHDNTVFDCRHGTEAEANAFAADLLLSDRKVAGCLSQGFTASQTAVALYTLPELVAFKIASMSARGYALVAPETRADFLRSR